MSKLRLRERNIVLLVRDVQRSVVFFQTSLQLPVRFEAEHFAELGTATTPIVLKRAENEAMASTGYSPFLCFDVADMDQTVRSMLEHGGHMDGPMQYPTQGKFASVRTPDGHMIGLYEPATVSTPPAE